MSAMLTGSPFFIDSAFAVLCFRLYLLLDHRMWYNKKDNQKRLNKQ